MDHSSPARAVANPVLTLARPATGPRRPEPAPDRERRRRHRPRPGRLGVLLALALVAIPAAPATAAPRHPGRHRRPPAPARHTPHPAAATVPAACADGSLVPNAENLARVAAATLCLINRQRVLAGHTPLHPSPALIAAATQHSLQMVAANFLDHVSPSGAGPVDRLRANGYFGPDRRSTQDVLWRPGFVVAENITAAIGDQATPAATVELWMNSPDFRANLLSPAFQDTGIGVAPATPALDGTDPGATYTQDFATRT